MANQIILASKSEIRQQLLKNAGVPFNVYVPEINEDRLRLNAKQKNPKSIAAILSDAKAHAVSCSHKNQLVLGCDQILDIDGVILTKPQNKKQTAEQLAYLRNNTHKLYSAASFYKNGEKLWQYTGSAELKMQNFSDTYLNSYLERNWQSIRYSVGAYKLEEEGARLFSCITGDYFVILGLPLLEILSYLTQQGILQK